MNQTHWKRTFFTIWSGQAVSLLTSSIVQFAIVLYLTDTTRSPMVLSVGYLLGFLPQGLLGPFAGVLVDRWDRKKIMLTSDFCIAMACLAIGIVGIFADLPLWLFLLVLFIRSAGSAFHAPSLSAVTPLLVPADQLTRCAGYSQTLQSVSMIIGPALAAMLYAAWDLEAIVFLDVLGALVGMGSLAVCTIPKLEMRHTERPHIIREALDGLRVLRSHKGLYGLLLVSALFFLAFSPAGALYPLLSMDYFGGTATHASIAEIVFSVGMMAGSILLGAWGGFSRKIVSIIGSIFLMGVALVLTGLLPPSGFVIFAFLSAVMGFACPFFSGVSIALFQEKVEPEYLGRVMSLSTSILTLATPLGLALSGATAEIIGLENWFLLAGIVVLASGVLCIFVPSVRNCDQ